MTMYRDCGPQQDAGWLAATMADAAYEAVKKELEDTYRVLYHVVSSYNAWRDFLPNELADNAMDIGEKHLRSCGWWPTDPPHSGSRGTGDAGAHDDAT